MDLDGWEARLVDLIARSRVSRTRKGSGTKFGKDVTRTEVLAARDTLFADLQQFRATPTPISPPACSRS